MALKLYNTLTRQKEEFKPINGKKVGMYVCGPTVYDSGHLGHARTYIVFDVIRKYLEELDYDVNFVSNITDVHDNIIERAKKENITIQKISDKYTKEFLEELKGLGIKKANAYPRVSKYIPQIVEFIKLLINKEYAYEKNNSVYFDVSKFKNYGKLSRRKLEEAKSGTRVDLDKYEKDEAADFALWKKSENGDEKVGASWESPWGLGRPGWHIECSVMSKELLGEQFDIHAGANDLTFPHHENEIAQSEAASGKSPFVKYWIHSGLLTVNGQKMSKSLNNFITIPEIKAKGFNLLALRYLFLQAHYRSPQNFTWDLMKAVQKGFNNLINQIKELGHQKGEIIKEYKNKFIEKISDDFNLPQALALTQQLLKSKLSNSDKLATLLDFDQVLGLGLDKIENKSIPVEIQELVQKREQARKDNDYQGADEIRKQIENEGFRVKDTLKGSEVYKV
ncbi:cysteine--tRNA ligase [Patescibacteria group bacterium]|nr:cysteine--tRNA ligase [Patescibacteria group bacterium]